MRGFFQGACGYHSERRELAVQPRRRVLDRASEEHIVTEAEQGLRESFEKRDIVTDQNHFCHRVFPSASKALNSLQIDLADLDDFRPRGEAGHDAHIAPWNAELTRKKINQCLVSQPFDRRRRNAHS